MATEPKLTVDVETTGLRPYHGDRLFSIILSGRFGSYYFNFFIYPDFALDYVLGPEHMDKLRTFFNTLWKVWRGHKIQFDLAMLAQEGIFPLGSYHCTRTAARLVYNEHQDYDLASCAERIGLKKDDAVERHIEEHHLWEWEIVPGKKQRKKKKFFQRVPASVIIPYGLTDGSVTDTLADSQEEAIEKVSNETPPGLPNLQSLFRNERAVTAATFRMERVGLRIDRPYCVRAARYEDDRAEKSLEGFKRATGKAFVASGKLFATVFESERDKWEWGEPTKTGQINPSFEGDVLKRFENPAARFVLDYRDAKSRGDFYRGFLYHADREDIIHPNLDPAGTRGGRYSSSDPNFQNLTAEEGTDLDAEFVVRRAIIPRPGFVLCMPDWDQMEYRMMLDYAAVCVGCETELIRLVKGGLDVHEASRQLLLGLGIDHSRGIIKNGNFAVLYGSGLDTLAWTIKGTRESARTLKDAIFRAAPEIKMLVSQVMATAQKRGNIFTWSGRILYCPDSNFAYKFPNRLIQGGCADVNKYGIVEIDKYLLGMKSRMILTVHDELPTEVHESELASVPRRMVEIMESVYPSKYLKLTASMEWSDKSMADKIKGYPV